MSVALVNGASLYASAAADKAGELYGEHLARIDYMAAEARRLDQEIRSIERDDESGGSAVTGPGPVLLALAAAGDGVTLRYLRYEAGRFSLRAEGPNAMGFFDRLRNDHRVRDARLSDVRATDDGLEEFSIAGASNDG